jgi:hypothetical protein
MWRTYRNRSQLATQVALAVFMAAVAVVACGYWLEVAGVRDGSIIAAAGAAAAAWILKRFWRRLRGRVRAGPDGVEVVDEFAAVDVPWDEIDGFRIVGGSHEVPQVVMERAGGACLRLRAIEGHGWTVHSARRSIERDVGALNAELERRRAVDAPVCKSRRPHPVN